MYKVHTNYQCRKFIINLPQQSQAKIAEYVELLKAYGFRLSMPYAKKITPNLYELRIKTIQNIRLFYTFYLEEIYIIHGFIKTTNQIPVRELKVARSRLLT